MGLFKGCWSPRKVSAQVYADGPNSNVDPTPDKPEAKNESMKKKLTVDDAMGDLVLFGEDSDDSDDDAAIERYDRNDLDKDDEVYKERNVDLLLAKMTPEEMFIKFDEDQSGMISRDEFVKMLPQLGIKLSNAKAIRIFDSCDKDGSGEIDLEEFKMAMFAVDPNTGNTLGFAPSSLLTPKDAFHLFDSNGSGKLDELEFADALEYFGMDVSDATQEKLFHKYDTDKSGFIEYSEFRAMWLQCADLKHELMSRGIEVPKFSTRAALMQNLANILDEEERREEEAMEEAKWFHEWQLERLRRVELARKAALRAQDELAAALDAAGQVYMLGPGQYGEFKGDPASRDELLFDRYTHVSEIWQSRVFPTYTPPEFKLKHATFSTAAFEEPRKTEDDTPRNPDLMQRKHSDQTRKETTNEESPKERIPFMRRRNENIQYDANHESPPKLHRQTWKPKDRVPVVRPESSTPEQNKQSELEELNKKFLEDRMYVRSLRFKGMHIMTNTGWLWGRQVIQAALSDSVAYAVTSSGQIYCWGGKNQWWKGISMDKNDEDDDETEDNTKEDAEKMRVLTSRSELLKMAAPKYAAAAMRLELEVQRQKQEMRRQKDADEEMRYEKYKRVVVYFDLWDPPPSFSTRLIFMKQVLLPKIDFSTIKASLTVHQKECFRLKVQRIEAMQLTARLSKS
ncbi:hypothetical protein AC1031_016193 [Aphanomyces cochlioides]|nr:hypothetical protein AC1031_016193 [Aphanomyces cochlioides]